jgi:hydrogenase expression/formation protein HypD
MEKAPNALNRPLLEKLERLGRKLAEERGRKLNIMEVCGTHTVAYARTGISDLVSPYIDLQSGPGCPICVTHQDDLDRVFSLTRQDNPLLVTFGDLLRVPGSHTTLEREMAGGVRVQICYSPLEAVERAAQDPGDRVVLIAIGFETTAPAMAAALKMAEGYRLDNFWLYPLLKRVPPALKALLENPMDLDGFLLPGHVSTVLGSQAFSFMGDLGFPSVVTGFESLDLLLGLYTMLKMIEDGKSEVGNAYSHVVREEGNDTARRLIDECFVPEPLTSWRGLGAIPESGYTIREPYSRHDARLHFDMEGTPAGENPHCACGQVITGRFKPYQCPLFGKSCTPSTPVGPCMVSTEGACGAYYYYR